MDKLILNKIATLEEYLNKTSASNRPKADRVALWLAPEELGHIKALIEGQKTEQQIIKEGKIKQSIDEHSAEIYDRLVKFKPEIARVIKAFYPAGTNMIELELINGKSIKIAYDPTMYNFMIPLEGRLMLSDLLNMTEDKQTCRCCGSVNQMIHEKRCPFCGGNQDV